MVDIVSGMNFFVNTLGIEYSDVPLAFSFRNQSGGESVIPDPWASGAATGVLNKIDNFYLYSGSGFFDGSTYMELSGGYSLDNSTILLSYERRRISDEILISSATGGSFSTFSGFYVGVNHANKLYMQYWNNVEGVFSIVLDEVLSDKNLIAISKINSIITLGKFDNNLKKFKTKAFDIYQNNFINSSKLYVGGSPETIGWSAIPPSNFSGIIDRMYAFNGIPFSDAGVLVSGFYCEPTGYAGEWSDVCVPTGYISGSGFSYTGVTGTQVSGYESGITGITGYVTVITTRSYTGITGYRTDFLGTYIDNCKNTHSITETVPLSGLITESTSSLSGVTGVTYISGYTEIELTGTITGIQNVHVTGEQCESFFTQTGSVSYDYDLIYLSSLTYKEISLLSTIDPVSDIVEAYAENFNLNKLIYNKDLIFDLLHNNYFYLDAEYPTDSVSIFANGQLLLESGYIELRNGYEVDLVPNIDYLLTGTTVETNEFFLESDDLIFDSFSGGNSIVGIEAHSSGGAIAGVNFENSLVFLNGQKLLSGVDYLVPNILNIPITGGDNYLFLKNNLDAPVISIGSGSIESPRQYNMGCVQIYLNGVRQKLGNNCIENSFFDLLSGNFTESDVRLIGIYNNSDDYFESSV